MTLEHVQTSADKDAHDSRLPFQGCMCVDRLFPCSYQIPFDLRTPLKVRIILVCFLIFGARDCNDFVSFDCGIFVPYGTLGFCFFAGMSFVSVQSVLNRLQAFFLLDHLCIIAKMFVVSAL